MTWVHNEETERLGAELRRLRDVLNKARDDERRGVGTYEQTKEAARRFLEGLQDYERAKLGKPRTRITPARIASEASL